jgi:hypothetical protein
VQEELERYYLKYQSSEQAKQAQQKRNAAEKESLTAEYTQKLNEAEAKYQASEQAKLALQERNTAEKESLIRKYTQKLNEAEVMIELCEDQLGSLLLTLEELTHYKALLSPKLKYNAYQNVLKEYRLIEKARKT